MENGFRNHMHSNRPAKSVLAAFMTASLLLSGCGGSSTSSSSPSGRTDSQQSSAGQGEGGNSASGGTAVADALYYQITEASIPDPKKIFENDPENQGKNFFPFMSDSEFAASPYADAKLTISPQDTFSADGTFYSLYQILYKTGEGFPITAGYCIYILEPPYAQWRCCMLPYSVQPSESYEISMFDSIIGISEDGVYLLMSSGSAAFCGWDGTGRILEEIETAGKTNYTTELTLYPADEALYAVSSSNLADGNSFTLYDARLTPVLTQNLEAQICGGISRDSGYLWYGFDRERNFAVWDKPNGNQIFSFENKVDPFTDFLLAESGAGEFVLTDINTVWAGDGSAPLRKVLSLAERGYVLQELLAMDVDENGNILIAARFEDKLCLLTLNQADEPDRQEIVVVTENANLLSNVASSFNRQNDQYRVTLVNPFDAEDYSDYIRQLQLEVSAGRGPDLIQSGLLDLEGCIENGYIVPLDDIIETPSDYWPAVLEYGKSGDSLYSVPYDIYLYCTVASRSLTGELESWTLEQMMDAVRNSPAEALEKDLDGLDIVLQYGLNTLDNPQLIDFDAGVSHLTERPFMDLLKFAKEYGDSLYYSTDTYASEEAGEYYHDGRLAVYTLLLPYTFDFLIAPLVFGEQYVFIGAPSSHGRGIYMGCSGLSLNSSSPSKECAKEFLRYLMSEEGQIAYTDFHHVIFMRVGPYRYFSCRRDVTELALEDYQAEAQLTTTEYRWGRWGLQTTNYPLSEEQIEQILTLFEDARPKWYLPSEINDMVCEELAPYFAGDCSAEEAAGKLDNRVQLYLDERK